MEFKEFFYEYQLLEHFYKLNCCLFEDFHLEATDPLKLGVEQLFGKADEEGNPKIGKSNALKFCKTAASRIEGHNKNHVYSKVFANNVDRFLEKKDASGNVIGHYDGFLSIILHLLPGTLSGFQMCGSSTPACRANCLHFSGAYGQLGIKTAGRLRRTWALAKRGPQAIDDIARAIGIRQKDAARDNKRLVIRLNGTSDLKWELLQNSYQHTLMQLFPDVVFYDYTKDYKRFDSELPSNYLLVYSRSEGDVKKSTSDKISESLLRRGYNVAIVFGPGKVVPAEKGVWYPGTERDEWNEKKSKNMPTGDALLPKTWRGFPVISGETHDLRFLEMFGPQQRKQISQLKLTGVVIGLVAKGPAVYENFDKAKKQFIYTPIPNNFVIQPTDPSVINDPKNKTYCKRGKEIYEGRNEEIRSQQAILMVLHNRDNMDEKEIKIRILSELSSPYYQDSGKRWVKHVDELIAKCRNKRFGSGLLKQELGEGPEGSRVLKGEQYSTATDRHFSEMRRIIRLLNGEIEPEMVKTAGRKGKEHRLGMPRNDELRLQHEFERMEKHYRDNPGLYNKNYLAAVARANSENEMEQLMGMTDKERHEALARWMGVDVDHLRRMGLKQGEVLAPVPGLKKKKPPELIQMVSPKDPHGLFQRALKTATPETDLTKLVHGGTK